MQGTPLVCEYMRALDDKILLRGNIVESKVDRYNKAYTIVREYLEQNSIDSFESSVVNDLCVLLRDRGWKYKVIANGMESIQSIIFTRKARKVKTSQWGFRYFE